MALNEIYNFLSLSDSLATAGQPTEAQLQAVADAGFETTINLGLLDPRYCLLDEAGAVGRLGMTYHHIPVDFQAPALEELWQFFRALDNASGGKTFVHCAANYRVSTFLALYGWARWDWSEQRARDHAAIFWKPNATWAQFFADALGDLK